jgi:hypothetical protein
MAFQQHAAASSAWYFVSILALSVWSSRLYTAATTSGGSFLPAFAFGNKPQRCHANRFSLHMSAHDASNMKSPMKENYDSSGKEKISLDSETSSPVSRRSTLLRFGGAVVLAASTANTVATGRPESSIVWAFDNAYPSELQAPSNQALDSRARQVEKIRQKEAKRASNVLVAKYPMVSATVWGSALWFLSGSRSNPIATPLANLLYNSTQETWLQDRNDGLFASLPWEYLVIQFMVFLALGFGTDLLVSAIADGGDRVISLQLAGVSLIAGASLELGRIASGEKKLTRDEANRQVVLTDEFARFAQERLVVERRGNCHRNEVVQAFRRYYAKYRQAESSDYPLTDLEIEQLVRAYCKDELGLTMSSAGFYTGVQINTAADVFKA